MGAGKSTIGAAVARRLGWPYADNDVVLRQVRGRGARDLARMSKSALHTDEQRVARALAGYPPPLVGSLAGSAFDDPSVIAEIRAAGRVIHLHAPVETLRERIAHSDRPWLERNPDGLAALLRSRETLFSRHADADLDAAQPVATVVDEVTALAAGWWHFAAPHPRP